MHYPVLGTLFHGITDYLHGHVINFFQLSVTSLRYCCILHINGRDRVRERLISLEFSSGEDDFIVIFLVAGLCYVYIMENGG